MELVDTLDLGSSIERCKSSNLLSSTIDSVVQLGKNERLSYRSVDGSSPS